MTHAMAATTPSRSPGTPPIAHAAQPPRGGSGPGPSTSTVS
jgi:hypothetical protein